MRIKIIYITSLFILLNVGLVSGQKNKLNVVTFNPCNSAYEKELLVQLTKDNTKYEISDSTGTIYLPETGIYKLSTLLNDYVTLVESEKLITIVKGQNYDTLTRATIAVCTQMHKPICGYFCCNKLCEGYHADHYGNGQKRIEGTFVKGFPIGQLIFYKPDGRKKEIDYYDEKVVGKLIRIQKFDN